MSALLDLFRSVLQFPPSLLAFVSALIVAAALSKRRKRGTAVPWFCRSRIGTVYLFRSRKDPSLYKLGYTGRKTSLRQREIEKDLGSSLHLVAQLQTPHAWVIEQRCHAVLRSSGWSMPWHPVLGGEWYRFPDSRSLQAAIGILEKTAVRTKLVARIKRSWPSGATQNLKIFP